MLFCPTCGNLLLLEKSLGAYRYYCRTCPYIYNIPQKMKAYKFYENKQVDSVLGGKESWENVEQTNVVCPKCSNGKAYFKQIQIRSADEPATLFYKCTNVDCNHQWNEN